MTCLSANQGHPVAPADAAWRGHPHSQLFETAHATSPAPSDRFDKDGDSALYIKAGSLVLTEVPPASVSITTTATKRRERRWEW